MTTIQQQKQISYNLFEEILDWIAANLDPDDMFTVDQLEDWAESNGWEKEE